MWKGDSFYIDTYTVHKTVDSSKQCRIFRGRKNYLAEKDDALSNSLSHEQTECSDNLLSRSNLCIYNWDFKS